MEQKGGEDWRPFLPLPCGKKAPMRPHQIGHIVGCPAGLEVGIDVLSDWPEIWAEALRISRAWLQVLVLIVFPQVGL